MPHGTSSDLANDRPVARLSRRRRLLLSITSSVLAVVVFGAIYLATRVHQPPATVIPGASSTLHTGERAPLDLSFVRLGTSDRTSLAAITSGRPAVVNFFASWCSACAAELKAFGTVSNTEAGKVVFVGIDTNDPDHGLAAELLRGADVRYPVLVDDSSLHAATAYGVDALPATFFLNAQGHVVSEVLGGETAPALTRRVADLESGHSS